MAAKAPRKPQQGAHCETERLMVMSRRRRSRLQAESREDA
jgi:hypothetical protein